MKPANRIQEVVALILSGVSKRYHFTEAEARGMIMKEAHAFKDRTQQGVIALMDKPILEAYGEFLKELNFSVANGLDRCRDANIQFFQTVDATVSGMLGERLFAEWQRQQKDKVIATEKDKFVTNIRMCAGLPILSATMTDCEILNACSSMAMDNCTTVDDLLNQLDQIMGRRQ